MTNLVGEKTSKWRIIRDRDGIISKREAKLLAYPRRTKRPKKAHGR